MEEPTIPSSGAPNKSWSMDDPGLRKEDEAGLNDPEEGLGTNPDARTAEAPEDIAPNTGLYAHRTGDNLADTKQEGGAETKGQLVFGTGTGPKGKDINLGSGNRKEQTSGASMWKKHPNPKQPEGPAKQSDEDIAGTT